MKVLVFVLIIASIACAPKMKDQEQAKSSAIPVAVVQKESDNTPPETKTYFDNFLEESVKLGVIPESVLPHSVQVETYSTEEEENVFRYRSPDTRHTENHFLLTGKFIEGVFADLVKLHERYMTAIDNASFAIIDRKMRKQTLTMAKENYETQMKLMVDLGAFLSSISTEASLAQYQTPYNKLMQSRYMALWKSNCRFWSDNDTTCEKGHDFGAPFHDGFTDAIEDFQTDVVLLRSDWYLYKIKDQN